MVLLAGDPAAVDREALRAKRLLESLGVDPMHAAVHVKKLARH
jgi:hypothetical protein